MNLGLSVFLEVFVHIVLLSYVFAKNKGLQEIPDAVTALVHLFLGTGLVVVALKGTTKDTWTYVSLVFLFLTIGGILLSLT